MYQLVYTGVAHRLNVLKKQVQLRPNIRDLGKHTHTGGLKVQGSYVYVPEIEYLTNSVVKQYHNASTLPSSLICNLSC